MDLRKDFTRFIVISKAEAVDVSRGEKHLADIVVDY